MDLENKEISYIVSSSDRIDPLISYLYSREYTILEIKGYYDGSFDDYLICWGQSNDDIMRDTRKIIREFNQDSVIFKLSGDLNAKKIFKSGEIKDLGVVMYNTDSNNISYLHNGISFSFLERKSYKFPKNKEDFKNGMVVECYSKSGEWVKRTVEDLDSEFPKLYSDLSKYNRVRITT